MNDICQNPECGINKARIPHTHAPGNRGRNRSKNTPELVREVLMQALLAETASEDITFPIVPMEVILFFPGMQN